MADLTPEQIDAIRKVALAKPKSKPIDTRRSPALRDVGKPAQPAPEPPKKRIAPPQPEERAAPPVSLPKLSCLKDYVREGDVRPALPPTAHERRWASRVSKLREQSDARRAQIEAANRARLIAAVKKATP